MQFTIHSVFFVLLALFSSTLALPMLHSRDVYDLKITYPMAGDKFTAGQTIVVTWNTSSIPSHAPNEGVIVLGRLTKTSENLDLSDPLAENFLLTAGKHSITFPSALETASDYILALFGDSGNISPEFIIESV